MMYYAMDFPHVYGLEGIILLYSFFITPFHRRYYHPYHASYHPHYHSCHPHTTHPQSSEPSPLRVASRLTAPSS